MEEVPRLFIFFDNKKVQIINKELYPDITRKFD